MITLAPEIAAPEGSVTWPRRTPEAVWADNALMNSKNMNANKRRDLFTFIESSDSLRQCESIHTPREQVFRGALAQLLTCIPTGSAPQTPGCQHHCLTGIGSGLQDRLHATEERDCGAAAARGALRRDNQHRIAFVEVGKRHRRHAVQHLL